MLYLFNMTDHRDETGANSPVASVDKVRIKIALDWCKKRPYFEKHLLDDHSFPIPPNLPRPILDSAVADRKIESY